MQLKTRLYLVLVLAFTLFSPNLLASLSSEIGLELRYFPEPGAAGQDTFQPSIRGEIEFGERRGDNSFDVVLFGRVDKEDSERSHVDVREALWTHVGDEWEFKAGVTKVFWGVTESRHLVDVINQNDQVENIDGEDKLGQPLTKLSFEKDWGTLDLFWLPYFRERSFTGVDGRLGFPLTVDTDRVVYDSGAEELHSDFALRYSHYIDELEFAISHFSGTSREPILQFNGSFTDPKFIPRYTTVDQTGLELQYIYEDWLLKFEGISNSGVGQRYSAAVAGFEYTQIGIFDSAADLGWLLEYLFDDRKENAPHSFERDLFVGWRYAFNDADSSEILAGVVYDPKTSEKFYSLEMSKRLRNDLKVNLEARVFDGASAPRLNFLGLPADPAGLEKTWFIQDEDYLQVELVKYF
ncbi:MAG: hypothetical protein C9356_05285 [Oleiphilus sp.]|nr:MAG: hypothetical protein C9356_05285 [Oleiphilus sp.]